jgi:hypothetical protein
MQSCCAGSGKPAAVRINGLFFYISLQGQGNMTFTHAFLQDDSTPIT